MLRCRHSAIAVILLLSGCLYGTRERVDQSVCELTSRPYDQLPPSTTDALGPSQRPLHPGHLQRRMALRCRREGGRTCGRPPSWSLARQPASQEGRSVWN